MDNLHVIRALETGFMTDSEVATLLYLIRSPDVCDECLPLLAVDTLPGTFSQSSFFAFLLPNQRAQQVSGRCRQSRVLVEWPEGYLVRYGDTPAFLFSVVETFHLDVTYAAIQVLYARIEGSKNEPTEDGEPEYTNVLAEKLIRAGAQCRGTSAHLTFSIRRLTVYLFSFHPRTILKTIPTVRRT